MKTKNNDFDFFHLDEYALDTEWVRQPALYFEYAKKLADARAELEQARSARDVVSAEIDRDIRDDPAKFGLQKITESAVEKAIILHSRYDQANQRVMKCKHEMDLIQAAVDALEHRKKALESLVYLQGQNYFSKPHVPKGAGDERERIDRVERSAVSKKVKRTLNE